MHAFPYNYRSAFSRAKTVNNWAWHAVQLRRTFWSEKSQGDRSDLVWSLKKHNESLGCRKTAYYQTEPL